MKLFFVIVAMMATGCTLGLCACRPAPPLPTEPEHVITIGDASFHGDCCSVSFDVLDALVCPESLHDRTLYITKCQAIGDDFDFCSVAQCHDTGCVRAHGVRCPYDLDAWP